MGNDTFLGKYAIPIENREIINEPITRNAYVSHTHARAHACRPGKVSAPISNGIFLRCVK